MLFDTNVVALTGRLAAEPELRVTNHGTQICKLRIAVNSQRRSRHGNSYSKPGFSTVVAFGDRAKACERHLQTDSRIAVQGLLDFYEWSNKKGQRSQRIEIIANHVEFLGFGPASKPDRRSGELSTDPLDRDAHIEVLREAIREEREHERANGTEGRDAEYEEMMERINQGLAERNERSAALHARPSGLSMKPRPAPNIQPPSPKLGHSSPYDGEAPEPPRRRR